MSVHLVASAKYLVIEEEEIHKTSFKGYYKTISLNYNSGMKRGKFLEMESRNQ